MPEQTNDTDSNAELARAQDAPTSAPAKANEEAEGSIFRIAKHGFRRTAPMTPAPPDPPAFGDEEGSP